MNKSWMNEYDTELGLYKYKGKLVISKTEEEKCMELWHDYMEWDKRGFSEFFLHEFGITIHDCITYKQLKLLCEVLIPHAKTYYHPRRK